MRDIVENGTPKALIVALLLIGSAFGAFADDLKMGGTGAALMMLEKLGATCTQGSATKVVVIPNLGRTGGLRAVRDRALDVAVVGRPLEPEELAVKGLSEVASVRTPFVLVTSQARPNGLNSTDVAIIFGSITPTWADGTPVRIILRPKSDSDRVVLGRLLPDMAAALDKASKRREIPIAGTDQDNVNMAESIPGSLAGASFTQIMTEKRNVRCVALDGVEPTLESFERGTYRYGRTFHFIVPTSPSPAAKQFIDCVRSPIGAQVLRDTGNLLNPD